MALATEPKPRRANAGRPTQLRLFSLVDPLTERFGSLWFRAVPKEPGVYFFRGSQGELLYIGQSLNLRARIGSYRHVTPEKNARRTLRLISKTTAIEWELCATAKDAIELERKLLLEHRPPFNRAGVWPGSLWWLIVEARNGKVHLSLANAAAAAEENRAIGPLYPGFRHVFGALARCLFRAAHPSLPMFGYPHGLLAARMPTALELALPEAEAAAQLIKAFAAGNVEVLTAMLAALPEEPSSMGREFWEKQTETLQRYAAKTPKFLSPIQRKRED